MTTGNRMSTPLPVAALDQLFTTARTFNTFTDQVVDDATLVRLYELYKWGPTSLNSQPGRVLFLRSAGAKQRLKPALMPNNIDKTMAAPVVAIVAHDTAFHDHMPSQFPAMPTARDMFIGNAALAQDTAVRNSTLQGAYLMLAARALGLSTGPMSGFNPQVVNDTFFPDGRWKANFLVNLGYGDPAGTRPCGPRLAFADAVQFA